MGLRSQGKWTYGRSQKLMPGIATPYFSGLIEWNAVQDQLEHFQELAHTEQMEAYAAVQRWAAAAQAAQQVPVLSQQKV